MKEKPPIPKCKNPACQCDLYPERQWWYDKRKKYCNVCAEERKREKDALRMKRKREEARDRRTQKIIVLEAENKELKEQHEHDVIVNQNLQRRIAQIRDWDREDDYDYR